MDCGWGNELSVLHHEWIIILWIRNIEKESVHSYNMKEESME